jgi:hypothetical protein
VVCVFARKIDGPLTSLVKQINEEVGKNGEKKLSAFVVILTDDSDEVKPQLEKLAEKEKIQNVPLTIGEIAAGPPAYKIDKDAEVTVLLWKNLKVVSNHAFKSGGLHREQIAAIMKDVPKLLED